MHSLLKSDELKKKVFFSMEKVKKYVGSKYIAKINTLLKDDK